MRKTSILFGLVLAVILSISMASALYNCQPSQSIMKLSSLSNAHLETYSSNQFSIGLCYNELFGVNYTLASPHSCTGSNTVAKLSQTSNAHIEGPAGTAFTVNVCYGDLICTLRSGVCQLNEAQITSISQTSNAHASTTNSFTYKICCSSAFALANNGSINLSTGTGAMSLVINSPVAGNTYNSSALLSITSVNATAVLYNFGTGNFSYTSPITLTLGNGSYLLNVYALNATTMIQSSVSFTITNSSTSSNVNNTNLTGTGAMSFTLNSPVAGNTYNGSIQVNITSVNATAVLYNFGTGNFSYTTSTIVALMNGSYTFTVYVSNATTLLQQSISFNIVNSTTNTNPSPTNNTNSTNGNGGDNDDDDNDGSSNSGTRTGTSRVSQNLEGMLEDNKPIVLGTPEAKKGSVFGFYLIRSMLILLILILFIIIAQILINRHFQSRNKRA